MACVGRLCSPGIRRACQSARAGQTASVIDRSGPWRNGESFDDLRDFVVAFTSRNYRADEIRRSVCERCGGTSFGLWLDDDEGCAQRRCGGCGETAFIGDSADWWDEAAPGEAACPCGREGFEIAVGFSMIDSGEVNWITVGGRCLEWGCLGCTSTGAWTTNRLGTSLR